MSGIDDEIDGVGTDESLETVNALIRVLTRAMQHSGANLVECAQASGVVWLSTMALISVKTGMTYAEICETLGLDESAATAVQPSA